MNKEIRYARIGEADILAKINTTTFHQTFRGIIPEETLKDRFSYEKQLLRFEKELSEKTTESSILFIDGEPIGMQTFAKDDVQERVADEIDIWRIYVLPEYWSTGAGAALMTWGLRELKEKGYRKVALWVVDENHRARAFYERMGFSADGEAREINPGRPVTELRYVKLLVDREE